MQKIENTLGEIGFEVQKEQQVELQKGRFDNLSDLLEKNREVMLINRIDCITK